MQAKTFGFIGSGRLTYLLLYGLQKSDALPQKVFISDTNEEASKRVVEINPQKIYVVSENRLAAKADMIFLAVHPPVVAAVAEEIKDILQPQSVIVSFIPTVSISNLIQQLNGFNRIVRMIPNAPSLIGKGFNPVVFSNALNEKERITLHEIFQYWGKSPEVPEDHLEAYAMITGMGPTYFWFQWLELQRLAEEFGMNNFESNEAVKSMLKGAIELLFDSDLPKEKILDLIPSYPLKKDEEVIRNIFAQKLSSLYQKLKSATK